MTLLRWNRLPALGVGLLLLACGGGGGGGTGPCTPGLATQLTKTGGDAQAWYVNNPLPTALSVTVRDANNCPVPGVAVDWTIQTGGGGLGATHSTTTQSTTNSSGVASTVDSVGSASPQVVRASAGALPTQDFTTTVGAPPTTEAVSLSGLRFNPSSVVVQANTGTAGVGDVTWTWNDNGILHNVTFSSGPAPLPAPSNTQATGTHLVTFTKVGSYAYHCTLHFGMDGTVTVVH